MRWEGPWGQRRGSDIPVSGPSNRKGTPPGSAKHGELSARPGLAMWEGGLCQHGVGAGQPPRSLHTHFPLLQPKRRHPFQGLASHPPTPGCRPQQHHLPVWHSSVLWRCQRPRAAFKAPCPPTHRSDSPWPSHVPPQPHALGLGSTPKGSHPQQGSPHQGQASFWSPGAPRPAKA